MTTAARRDISVRFVVTLCTVLSLLLMAGCTRGQDGENAGVTTPRLSVTSPATSPPPASWGGARNPCSLLTDSEIRAVTHFDVDTERLDSTFEGTTLPNCLSQHRSAQTQGGYVTVTMVPPGSVLLQDRSNLSNIQEISGVGKQAFIGHHNKGLGPGTNVAVVDMGDGGFLLSVQVFSETTPDQLKALVSAAASRWGAPAG